MEQVRDCEEADLGVPSHGDEGEVGTDRGKRKKPARLGFKLRRVLNIARKGDPCTPVQPWKVEEDAEDLGTSPARNGSHTAAGDNQKPTCSKQHLRHRFPSVPRSSSSRTLVPNFWEAKDILLQHSGMSREGATSRSLEEEKLAKPFLSRLPAAAPSSSSDLKGRPGYGFKLSTDLLRAFDRIWALEEHHASSLSLVKKLGLELEQAQACVQELLQENQSEGEAVLSVRDQLHEERRRRRRSESLRRKLAREFSDLKSVYLRSLRDLESEKKAHEGLAEFCDELAEGIREYEELRELRRSDGGAAGHGRCRRHLVLQVSEAWLDARRQAKLARVRGGDLAGEVEGFLQAIRLHPAAEDRIKGGAAAADRRRSLESVPFNDAVSAPWNDEDDDDDELAGDLRRRRHSFDLPGTARRSKRVEEGRRSDATWRTLRSAPEDRRRRESLAAGDDEGPPPALPPGVKANTLEARLLEARLDSQRARHVAKQSVS
ncbi:unnamed protein product [Spirodela intermedia]|uniref:Uncharacterized protein n=1 Tax=Spirodela intermedia TaxID=51605 RepID=A0A7I8KI36_SPIIN|nr:unnamed protein product [Spirodela intermedia]